MALPTDGQNANELDEVTEVPAGKELIFFDPTTNAGGIITLENLTKQILNGIASQAFNLDAGQMTILQALNSLNGKSLINLGNVDVGMDTLKIYSNGTTIKLIVKWKSTLHAIAFDTNNKLYIQTSIDSGSTWKTIREI